MSHTVSIDVKFENAEALTAAVEAIGGAVIGFGDHKLFQNGGATVNGFGFTLPGWNFPLVATESGKLAYDDYNGAWGNVADIDILTAEYSFQAAKTAADTVGWLSERVDVDGAALLRVFHPTGGYLDISSAGSVEAFGFNGVGCHSAATELATAMGSVTAEQPKAEFYNQQNQNHELE